MAYKITVNQETCIGCGACANACNNFKLVNGKSKPVKAVVPQPGCNKEAEALCPVKAIKVEKA